MAVVGAGISGLAAAWSAQRAGASVLVLEASERCGGVVTTSRVGAYLFDAGPATLLLTPSTSAMLDELGLGDAAVSPPPVVRDRFIVRDGQLHAVPASPGGIFSTRLLSTRGKVRALCEPLVRRRVASMPEESLASLVRRRLGEEVLRYLVDPMVSGVYAGDVERLSANHALKMLATLERTHGSIVIGALRGARNSAQARAGSAIRSFPAGMQQVPEALAGALGNRVHYSESVVGMRPFDDVWELSCESGGTRRSVRATSVVVAIPSHRLGTLRLPRVMEERLAPVKHIPYVPMATLALGFRRGDVAHPLNGFGMLVPSAERAPLLGALFSSTMFPARTPSNEVLLTCFAGGARIPVAGDDDGLIRDAVAYLTPLLGITGTPTLAHVTRWAQAIPQPVVGHDAVLRAIDEVESEFPGLVMAGSYRHGVSIGDCLASGVEAGSRARSIASRVFPS